MALATFSISGIRLCCLLKDKEIVIVVCVLLNYLLIVGCCNFSSHENPPFQTFYYLISKEAMKNLLALEKQPEQRAIKTHSNSH